MEKVLNMKLWSWSLLLGLLLTGSTTFVSCSSEDEKRELSEWELVLKAYINEADERVNVSDEERAKTYAPFVEWRADNPDSDEPLFNLRFTTNAFDHQSENALELPDPNYEPSRDGLDNLKLSGSARPNKKQLTALAATLKEKAGNLPVYVIDLRAEMHALINGHHLSQYGFRNWATIGMTRDRIIKEEKELVASVKGQKFVYAKIGSSTHYEPANPKEEVATEAMTEEEAVKALGLNYYRLTALDHVFQDDETLDNFFEFYKSLPPSGAWLHFHCQAGRGRTTFFMCLVDMLMNPQVSLKDILYRQALIGGTSMYNDGSNQTGDQAWRQSLFKEISVMVPIVYEYVQENKDNGYSVTWSQWENKKYGYLINWADL